MIVDELPATGDLLFRWRSYLPLVLLPLFVLSLRDDRPPAPFSFELFCLAIALSGLQGIIITCTIAFWKNAVGVNVIYATRGFWSIVLVWTLGRWIRNDERVTIGLRGMALRFAGALLIFGAIVLAVVRK